MRVLDFGSRGNLGGNSPFGRCESMAIAVGEIKRHNLTISGSRLIQAFETNSDNSVKDALEQLTGYHASCNCQYRFLSTYEHTWATQLAEDGTLLISSPFHFETSGDLSVISMMYYLLTLASTSEST